MFKRNTLKLPMSFLVAALSFNAVADADGNGIWVSVSQSNGIMTGGVSFYDARQTAPDAVGDAATFHIEYDARVSPPTTRIRISLRDRIPSTGGIKDLSCSVDRSHPNFDVALSAASHGTLITNLVVQAPVSGGTCTSIKVKNS